MNFGKYVVVFESLAHVALHTLRDLKYGASSTRTLLINVPEKFDRRKLFLFKENYVEFGLPCCDALSYCNIFD